MEKFYHSVYLDESLCKGCINCIKRCPTQAIRVRNGKAVITKEFCIDCGVCIRICPHHAKQPQFDPLKRMEEYKYTVALPAPSLYGQFNNLDDINIVLTALKKIGFDDVFEVSATAELVSELTREYVKEHKEQWPIISTACPSVTRLIRVRFPNLIAHLLPIQTPAQLTASMARKRAVEKTKLLPEEIGVFFISPCPSKVSASKTPMGIEKSELSGVFAIKDVYPRLLGPMQEVASHPETIEELAMSGKIGISWGSSGGEAGNLLTDNYLAADGIENVIRVLEDLEDEKLNGLEFIELNACSGGCVGGVLTVENPYAAKVKLKRLRKYLPISCNHLEEKEEQIKREDCYWTQKVEFEPVFRIGNSIQESIELMNRAEEILTKLPGLDCGSCGAPTCKALAEDIVRGVAKDTDCIHLLREYIRRLSD